MYTFWNYDRKRWERDAGLRIDHLLLSTDLRSRLVDAGIDKWVRGEDCASDHAPAWLVLSNRPRRAFPSRSRKGK
jgi:exodeoxyribonuclease-3